MLTTALITQHPLGELACATGPCLSTIVRLRGGKTWGNFCEKNSISFRDSFFWVAHLPQSSALCDMWHPKFLCQTANSERRTPNAKSEKLKSPVLGSMVCTQFLGPCCASSSWVHMCIQFLGPWCASSSWAHGVHPVLGGPMVCIQFLGPWCASSSWVHGVHPVFGSMVCIQFLGPWCASCSWVHGVHPVLGPMVCI